ncbi:MAG: hypothetical protein KF701_02755 [Anaerolineales bacterium]|nr:MAG: hypothetical protein KF701_02755 [Anaerolineales bacterium]
MKSKVFAIFLAAGLLLSACSFPSSNSPDAASLVQTAAASTVSAQLTESALLVPTATETPLPTATSEATETPSVTNTAFPTTSSGGSGGGGVNPTCDSMAFVTDVTIPDGTDLAPGATFTKTWRIRNSGTCSWSTSYSVVFSSGAAMGGPATQPLTATIAPNSTLDISVNLTAPSTPGTHTGYWMLRNASGQTFGSFYVIIDVVGSGGTGGTGTTFIAAQVGQVSSSSSTSGNPHTGTSSGNRVQAFALFDLSSIPNGSTITQVTVDFTKFDTVSDPFAAMGCLKAIPGSYFPLDGSDYSDATSGADIEWCSFTALSTASVSEAVKTRAQAALGGSKMLEYRIAFGSLAGHDTLVRFLNNGLKLIITYTEP